MFADRAAPQRAIGSYALATFEKKASFEIPIAKPASADGATTLYPTRMLATWNADTEEYTFEFDTFETID